MSGARYISSRVMKMLYAHSGNECANPSCHTKLVYIEDNAKDDQICHIEAASPDGPRYNPNQTDDERSGYDNLILLCHKCHDMIDNNPETYTVELLKKWKKEHEAKYKTDNKEKVFRTPIPDGLLPRDNEVDKLFDGISNNRIYNLIGVGGSGKSSLAYLMIQKYKDNFNEIAFVVVNSDIKQDIVTQLNRTLKFELKKDLYLDVVSHLQENFKSELPNLLVLDINETADKDKIDNFITEILQDNLFLDGWKFLILTRENVDTRKRIPFHSLKDEDGFDFLKKLFLDRAGERYEDFGDFETLFKVIFYNPLLAEQLGFYLSNEPQTATIDDIITILYGTTFREEDMQGNSALQHDETIISFLKNLIVYDKMDINERTLLRHFVLWQSDYISYDVIADLLNGVFKTDGILKKVLKALTNRSIIVTKINDDKVLLCYKLHGLLAYSLREQINFKKEDWEGYWDNVERIYEYSYYNFLPYADCIGNSLFLSNTTNYKLLINFADKLQDVWEVDYVYLLYTKVIKILNNLLSFDNDNSALQDALASTFNNIARFQAHNLRDYELSKSNYENAILIREQLPKNNPTFQKNLASSYTNYATLLKDHLKSFDLAESNYEKAIAILEKMPKNNPEYQNALALAYNNYATLKDVQVDYESAILYYKKTIAIEEQLPTEGRDLNILAMSYYNLASIQHSCLKDYELAKINYKKAVAFFEQYKKDNPEYQNNMASAYHNLAYLQTQCEDFEFAISNYEKALTIRRRLATENSIFFGSFVKSEFGLIFSLCSNNKFEQAQSVLHDIKPMTEKYLADHPDDVHVQYFNQRFDELLKICSIC